MGSPNSGVWENHSYRPLPEEVETLCNRTGAPPRLIAHLILVHDTAATLIDRITKAFPNLQFDKDSILFGAATHDLGKTTFRNELIEPGTLHESHGVELLKELGVPKERARFAFTHGNWMKLDQMQIEDMLVALADHCWKGKRNDELEALTVGLLSKASGHESWQCYAALDEILQDLTATADSRLAWQMSFSAE